MANIGNRLNQLTELGFSTITTHFEKEVEGKKHKVSFNQLSEYSDFEWNILLEPFKSSKKALEDLLNLIEDEVAYAEHQTTTLNFILENKEKLKELLNNF